MRVGEAIGLLGADRFAANANRAWQPDARWVRLLGAAANGRPRHEQLALKRSGAERRMASVAGQAGGKQLGEASRMLGEWRVGRYMAE